MVHHSMTAYMLINEQNSNILPLDGELLECLFNLRLLGFWQCIRKWFVSRRVSNLSLLESTTRKFRLVPSLSTFPIPARAEPLISADRSLGWTDHHDAAISTP